MSPTKEVLAKPESRFDGQISQVVGTIPRVTSTALADAAEKLRAQGKSVLSLYGAPYWSPPEHVLKAATEAARQNQNAPSNGFVELRRAIVNHLEKDHVSVDPDCQIVITNGAMHALSLAFTTLLNTGDEVVLFRPSFFFFGVIRIVGGVPVYAQTDETNKWRWDAIALERSIGPRTKAIVLNSPTNPTGYVASEDDLLAIADIAAKHNLIVVSDECYDNMVYDGGRHLRVASIRPLAERTITVCSFTKTLAMQPWRIGFLAGPASIVEPIRKTLEWTVLRCSHVAQRAAQAALNGPQAWVDEIARRFQRCRDIAIEGLGSTSNVTFVVPRAGPFLFLNVRGTQRTGAEFAKLLLHEYGIPVDDGAFFGSDDHVRFPFGAEEDVVAEATNRIKQAAKSS